MNTLRCLRFTPLAKIGRVTIAALLSLAVVEVFALPVFPGAVGYGTDTPAGRGAANDEDHIYEVTHSTTTA